MSSSRTRILTAAGVAAPVLWAAAVVYCGAIRPGYDPANLPSAAVQLKV